MLFLCLKKYFLNFIQSIDNILDNKLKLNIFLQFVWQNAIVVQLLGPHVFALRAAGTQCLRFLGECEKNNVFVHRTCFSYKSKSLKIC